MVNTILHGVSTTPNNPDPGVFFMKKEDSDDNFFTTSAEMLQMHATTAAMEQIVADGGPLMSKKAAAEIINETRKQMGEDPTYLEGSGPGDYNSDLHTEMWRDAEATNNDLRDPSKHLHTTSRIYDDMLGPEKPADTPSAPSTQTPSRPLTSENGESPQQARDPLTLYNGSAQVTSGPLTSENGKSPQQARDPLTLYNGSAQVTSGPLTTENGESPQQTRDPLTLYNGSAQVTSGPTTSSGPLKPNGSAQTTYDPNARRYTPRMRGSRGEQPQPNGTAEIQAFIALETAKHDPRLTPEAKAEASQKEVANILLYDTVRPEHPENINELEISKRVRMKVFTKVKRDGQIKSRAPTGIGRFAQDKRDVPDRFSPTASKGSIMLGLKASAIENRLVSTADVKSAYLNAPLPESTSKEGVKFRRILELEGEMLAHFLEQRPEWEKYICKGYGPKKRHAGSMFLVIQKALYGLLESGLIWYDHIVESLLSFGYLQSASDPCVFHDGKGSSLILYVDDLLILAKNKAAQDDIVKKIRDKYTTLTHTEGEKLDYLNMAIVREEWGFYVHQKPYFDKMLNELGFVETVDEDNKSLPYRNNLFDIDPESPALDEDKRSRYVTIVMQLMFAATRTRCKILLPTVFCSSRLSRPTEEDQSKLDYCLNWLNNHRSGGICIGKESDPDDLKVYVWADASDNSHHDAKGHSGIVISIGRRNCSPVFVMSKKQTLVARSSTESEMLAVYTSVPLSLWTRDITCGARSQTEEEMRGSSLTHDEHEVIAALCYIPMKTELDNEYNKEELV